MNEALARLEQNEKELEQLKQTSRCPEHIQEVLDCIRPVIEKLQKRRRV